ncbi:paired amphipathic helix protein Sin3b-like [Punica granatum]|uniref:Histone deacetylase interacting domain-containing protein n=2 Tax=Punica granatum TaxID=22663 RepID=A0A218XMI3_PUNGR|nr:paired amphipathic helix protein Sin3b-like [Punica granatum]OWM86124.1 hypothetical protein CDL15_Pgr010948 [Punica granatum]PKI33474.1 hypothetical protein CRG98_046123 [Punica granatum]
MVKVMRSLHDAIGFIHKVRDAFGNESLELHLFYEALHEFSSSCDYSVFVDKVTMLLGGRPDLLLSLNFFMPDECKIEVRGDDDPHHDKAMAKLMFQSTVDFVNRARIQLTLHPGVYELFVEIVSTHRGNLLETYSKVSKLLKDFPELLLDCSSFFPKSVIKRATEPETRYLPSYRLLPETKAKSSCPRSSLAAQVLNHQLVLKSSFPTSSSSGNQHDDELFFCEDYRYELDMLIETTRSAITRIKSFLEQDLRCIEQIYGERGLEMADEVQKKPTKALPVVLRRLEQRVAQWVEYRLEMNELWKQFRQSQ